MNSTPIGLALTLSDGKDYCFAPMRLGPKGDPVRKLLAEHSRVLTEIIYAELPADAKLADGIKYQTEQAAREDTRRVNFVELATLALADNYENAREIAENLISPDLMPVVIRIVRGGQYPEGFTQTPSKASPKTV